VGWNRDKSNERIKEHLDGMEEIKVEKLKREADLESLLSETTCREIYGAHVYIGVSNFASLASAATDNQQEIKRLIQALHVYQREVSRIVEEVLEGVRVHFQGSRLHALFYRPIDDGKTLATRAALLELILKDFVASVFNPAFPNLSNFVICGGCDLGTVIGTQNGVRGDRELLFLGGAANHAAHAIGPRGQLRLTQNVYDNLPSDLQAICEEVTDSESAAYQLEATSKTDLDALCEKYEIDWSRQSSRQHVEDDQAQFPLSEIEYGGADVPIDMDSLSIKNSKRILACSIFADLCGFTRYVDSADTEEKKEAAMRVMHAIRKEFARVLTDDFDGVRVQYQGDNIQGAFHLPADDEKMIVRKAIRCAAGFQSSMEVTLKEHLPEASDLHLAVGLDVGTTLFSKLGSRGARDRICLGEAVENAARMMAVLAEKEVGVSEQVYQAMPQEYAQIFEKDQDKDCYVASSVGVDRLDRLDDMKKYDNGATVSVSRGAEAIVVGGGSGSSGRKITPSRTYSE
jgi:class 3 adenylate cyclase